MLTRPDALRGLDAPHHRHLHIHQDQIEMLAGNEIERLLSVIGQIAPMAPFAEQSKRQFLVNRMILDQEDVEGLLQFTQGMTRDEFLGRCLTAVAIEVKDPAQRSEKLFLRDRLGKETADSDFLATQGIAAHGTRRQHEHRDAQSVLAAQALGQFIAVHIRHVRVKQDAVKIFALVNQQVQRR